MTEVAIAQENKPATRPVVNGIESTGRAVFATAREVLEVAEGVIQNPRFIFDNIPQTWRASKKAPEPHPRSRPRVERPEVRRVTHLDRRISREQASHEKAVERNLQARIAVEGPAEDKFETFRRITQEPNKRKEKEKARDVAMRRNVSTFREPTATEVHEIMQMADRVKQVLAEFGVDNPTDRVADISQVLFSTQTEGGETGPGYIIVGSTPEIRQSFIYYHESSHFAATMGVRPDQKDQYGYSVITHGFSRFEMIDRQDGGVRTNFHNAWEEMSADLFALRCSDTDQTNFTSYDQYDSFMIAMVRRFAELKSIPPLEAYKQMFKAKTERDTNFLAELGQVLGQEVVTGIDQVVGDPSPLDENILEQIAQSGGFRETYIELKTKMESGEAIDVGTYIPGIRGRLVTAPYTMEQRNRSTVSSVKKVERPPVRKAGQF